MNANWDLNPDPSVSSRVPLPLDHLHSRFSLLINSYPRAFVVSDSMTLTLCTCTLHAFSIMGCACACTSSSYQGDAHVHVHQVEYHHLPNTILICFI